MDLMQDWLAPTIQHELSQALQWKEAALNAEQMVGRDADYSDDGSNLRIQCSKKGVVQISKFLTFTPPIQTILSDKTTRIGARISSNAARKYEDKERNPVTKNTTGGLIQILSFEIVATHLGPRSDRLTLLVNDFQSLGSNGSGAFSFPRPIESPDKGCSALLDKLIDIRAQEKATSSHSHSTRENSAAASSIHSQVGLVGNDNDPAFESQTMLATQIPLIRDSHSIRQHNSIAQSSKKSVSGPSKVLESLSEVMYIMRRPENGPTKLAESKIDWERKAGVRSSMNAHPLVHATNQENGTNININEKADRNKEESFVEEAEVAQPIQDKFKDANSQMTEESSQPKRDQTSGILSSAEVENNLKRSVVNLDLSAGSQNSQIDKKDNTSPRSSYQERSSKRRKLDDRIRSRDVKISKNQESLLNRPDSWLPADPYHREPRANVPIALLETFNRNADLNAERKLKVVSDQSEAPINGLVTLGDDEAPDAKASWSPTESDIDSEEWPPSPIRDQLPPDSSPPALLHFREQNDVSEPLDPQTGVSPLVSQHTKVAIPDSRQDNPGRRHASDEVPSASTNHQEPLSSSDIHPLPPHMDNISSQKPNQQLVTEANEPGSPSGTTATSQFQGVLLSAEATKPSWSPPDSDIEMTIPIPLHKTIQTSSHVPLQDSLPSTASQAKQPFTQVKRTPYPAENVRRSPNLSSPNKIPSDGDKEYETLKETFEQSNAWIPSTAPTLVPKSDSFSLSSLQISSKSNTSHSNEVRERSAEQSSLSTRPVESNCTTGFDTGELSLKANDVNGNVDSMRREETENISKLANTATKDPSPESPSQICPSGKRALQADEASIDGKHDSKREKTRATFFYPERSGRRGRFPIPPSLNVSDIPDDLPDPAISARQHREDWFAARRSSESSATRDSPISPVKGHAISASSLEGRSTRSNSVLATPTFIDGHKTTQEVARANHLSSIIHEKVPGVYHAGPLQVAALEQPSETNLAPSFETESVQNSHTFTGSSALKYVSNQGINNACEIPQLEEDHDARLMSKPTRTPTGPQGLISNISPPPCGREVISADVDGHFVRSPRQSAGPEISPFQSTFKTFKTVYPDYVGDTKHFLTLCKKIEKLWKLESLHKSMWDDFLIRNKIDYATHVIKCMDDGDDPMPYERFYNDQIDEPKYRKKVLTPQNLDSIIYGSDNGRNASSRDVRVVNSPTTTTFTSLKSGAQNRTSPSADLTEKATVLIDLTDDDREGKIPMKKSLLSRSESPTQSHTQRQGGPGIANGNTQVSRTPDIIRHPNMPPCHPTTSGSQNLPHPGTSIKCSVDEIDAAHTCAERSLSSKTDLEMPPRKKPDRMPTRMRGKGREARTHTVLNLPTKASLKDPSANSHLEGQAQDSNPPWWQDEDTPFKKFVDYYYRICPSKGNSYATPDDIARGKREHKRNLRKVRHLDVLGWNLASKHQTEPS